MPTKKQTTKADSKNPCWKGYEKIGMKKKNGKLVPNCVPKKTNNHKLSLTIK